MSLPSAAQTYVSPSCVKVSSPFTFTTSVSLVTSVSSSAPSPFFSQLLTVMLFTVPLASAFTYTVSSFSTLPPAERPAALFMISAASAVSSASAASVSSSASFMVSVLSLQPQTDAVSTMVSPRLNNLLFFIFSASSLYILLFQTFFHPQGGVTDQPVKYHEE